MLMKKLLILLIPLLFTLLVPSKIFAQKILSTPKEEYFKAQVVDIEKQGQRDDQGYKNYFQTLKVRAEDGPQKGKILTVENGDESQITKDQFVSMDQKIILVWGIRRFLVRCLWGLPFGWCWDVDRSNQK